MSRLMLGILCGLLFGAVSVATMIPRAAAAGKRRGQQDVLGGDTAIQSSRSRFTGAGCVCVALEMRRYNWHHRHSSSATPRETILTSFNITAILARDGGSNDPYT
jgi:hypothetical protein